MELDSIGSKLAQNGIWFSWDVQWAVLGVQSNPIQGDVLEGGHAQGIQSEVGQGFHALMQM